MAVASLVCSCAGLLLGFFATVPGIILGFKALRQIKTNPGLSGKGLATTGLVAGGCLTLAWIPLAFILTVATISSFRAVKSLKGAPVSVQSSSQTPNEDIAADLAPDGSGWMSDLEGVSFPDTPLTGRLGGLMFTPSDIALRCEPASDLQFTYRVSTPTQEELLDLDIDLGQQEASKYSGRTITVRKDGTVTVQPSEGWSPRAPSFRMLWSEPGTKPFRDRLHDIDQPWPCALRLEFGQLKDGKIPGRIYLCLLDRKKSFVRGKFLATVTQSTPFGSSGTRTRDPRADEPPSDTNPDSAGWRLDLASTIIPDVPATGRVHGVAFKTDRATLEGTMLKLRQGVGFFADREFEVLIWDAATDPAKLVGRKIEVLPSDDFGQKPSVRVAWMGSGQGVPESFAANVYAMNLEFLEMKNGRLSGKIYLCVADHQKSFVRGKFTASLPQFMTAPAPNLPPRPALPPNFPVRPPPGSR